MSLISNNENKTKNGSDKKENGHSTFNIDDHLNINAVINKEFKYEKIKEIADWLLERVDVRPKIGIVCGSGLGGLGDRLENPKVFPYASVPNFPVSTGKLKHIQFIIVYNKTFYINNNNIKVSGHKGNLLFGKLNGIEVVCMQGRFHSYEGYGTVYYINK